MFTILKTDIFMLAFVSFNINCEVMQEICNLFLIIPNMYSNCTDDHYLCFHSTDSTILLHVKSKLSSFKHSSEPIQAGFCQTWSEILETSFLTLPLKHVILMSLTKALISLHPFCLRSSISVNISSTSSTWIFTISQKPCKSSHFVRLTPSSGCCTEKKNI